MTIKSTLFTLLFTAASTAPLFAGNRPPEAPSGLLMDLLSVPLGLENSTPRMSWIVNDPKPNEVQTAYHILVADCLDRLAADQGNFWDSGKVDLSESSNVLYAGSALQPGRVYHWKVRTWDRAGTPGPFSEPQKFATGLHDQWSALPIWSDADKGWEDYTVEVDFTVTERAAGIHLRHQGRNGYLWQIFIQGDQAMLRPHRLVNGSYSVLKQVPINLEQGTPARLKVEIQGNRFTSYLNGEQVDVLEDDTQATGYVGFRHGTAEQSSYHSIRVHNADGDLIVEDFSNDKPQFFGGRIENGALHVDSRQTVSYDGAANNDFVFLRKSFTLPDKEIKSAIAHVTALSPEPANQYVYKLYMNGQFVGAGPERGYLRDTIVPAHRKISTRDPDAINRYNTFDVSGFLKPGRENIVGAFNYTTQDKRFLFQMRIDYADGSHDIIGSDGSWRALPAGNTVVRNLGNSGTGYFYAPMEGLNANHFPWGWNMTGFDDSDWQAAREEEPITGLTASATPNTERHLIEPKEVIRTGDNRYFIDFGKAVVAGFQLRVNGRQGHEVEIRLGEELSAPRTVRHRMRTRNIYQEVWTLKDGPQILENWGYRVFRYAEVLNAPETVNVANIRAVELRQPFDDDDAHFESSDPVLNDVWEVCKYSLKAVALDMYVDTHTRERLNYEGDGIIHQISDYAVKREYSFPRFSIEHLYYRPTWPTEYKQQSVMMAWQDYMYTGNPDSIRRHYDALKTKTLEKFMNDQGLIEKGIQEGGNRGPYGRDKVDWPRSELDGFRFTNINTVINAFNQIALSQMADIAAVAGKADDAARYQALADQLREGMNKHLYDAATGRFKDGRDVDHTSLHASAFPLGLGAVNPEHIDKVADFVESRGMAGSVYLAQFLLDGLYLANRGDAARSLMNSTELRSWGHMIYNLGATIVMEAWDPSIKPNTTFSHTWASAPANVIPRGMFGIVPLEAGFNQFQIKPQPGGLEWATITKPSIKGPIRAAFKQDDDHFEMTVHIPANTQATVLIPVSENGSPEVEMNGEAQTGPVADGFMRIDGVGSGQHTFQSRR